MERQDNPAPSLESVLYILAEVCGVADTLIVDLRRIFDPDGCREPNAVTAVPTSPRGSAGGTSD